MKVTEKQPIASPATPQIQNMTLTRIFITCGCGTSLNLMAIAHPPRIGKAAGANADRPAPSPRPQLWGRDRTGHGDPVMRRQRVDLDLHTLRRLVHVVKVVHERIERSSCRIDFRPVASMVSHLT